jgi:hypothetical protein
MKTLAWILKHVLLPLSPLIIGATARGVQQGALSFDLISPAELGFSMAMLNLMMSMNASRLTNPDLRQALVSIFQLGVIIFLVLFAWSVYVEADINSRLKAVYTLMEGRLATGGAIGKDQITDTIRKNDEILDRLRLLTLCLAVVVLPLTIFSNKKYELEKL